MRLPAALMQVATTGPLLLLSTRAVSSSKIHAVTFNIAAVNNNPFEYWLTSPDSRYNELMDGVEMYMNLPHVRERAVGEVFEWYTDIESMLINSAMVNKEELALLKERWTNDLAPRKVISGFLKDPVIGTKRLVSMPDRVTNTINTINGTILYRPTPINCYPHKFKDISDWWRKWHQFMFAPNPLLPNGKSVAMLIKPIPRSKYPELTEADERISLQLQILCQAIFDAILVYMLNKVSLMKFDDANVWQDLRANMCQALNLQKNTRLMEIIKNNYAPLSQVICLQEVAQVFAESTRKELSAGFEVFAPASAAAATREQNSVILLRRGIFTNTKDVTEQVIRELKKLSAGSAVPVEDGDLLVVQTWHQGKPMLIASFHGDTDGLATIPVLRAVHSFATNENINRLIFGLDANAYEHPKKGKQLDVRDFAAAFRDMGMTSCWGREPDPTSYTTYNARTYLQPQLNKASGRSETRAKGDVNPKDFIVAYEATMMFDNSLKDNTGEFKYIEDQVFPTMSFPSDHGIVSTEVNLIDESSSRRSDL